MIVWRHFVLECCKFSRAALPLALVTAIAPALAEAGEALLEPGSYCVEVRLELQHLSDTDATKEVVICVDAGKDPTAALRALSTNTRSSIAQSLATVPWVIPSTSKSPAMEQVRPRVQLCSNSTTTAIAAAAI